MIFHTINHPQNPCEKFECPSRDVLLEVRINGDRINGLLHLLLNGKNIGVNITHWSSPLIPALPKNIGKRSSFRLFLRIEPKTGPVTRVLSHGQRTRGPLLSHGILVEKKGSENCNPHITGLNISSRTNPLNNQFFIHCSNGKKWFYIHKDPDMS